MFAVVDRCTRLDGELFRLLALSVLSEADTGFCQDYNFLLLSKYAASSHVPIIHLRYRNGL